MASTRMALTKLTFWLWWQWLRLSKRLTWLNGNDYGWLDLDNIECGSSDSDGIDSGSLDSDGIEEARTTRMASTSAHSTRMASTTAHSTKAHSTKAHSTRMASTSAHSTRMASTTAHSTKAHSTRMASKRLTRLRLTRLGWHRRGSLGSDVGIIDWDKNSTINYRSYIVLYSYQYYKNQYEIYINQINPITYIIRRMCCKHE